MGVEGGGSAEPLQAARELGEPSSGLCSQVVTHDMADAPVLQGQKSLEMTQQCPWLSEVPVATSCESSVVLLCGSYPPQGPVLWS